jgi:hypothetical protein
MCPCADNVWGLKPVAEAKALLKFLWAASGFWIDPVLFEGRGNPKSRRGVGKSRRVGERCVRGEAARGSVGGVYTSANAGISSAKTGANPVRRKPKGS